MPSQSLETLPEVLNREVILARILPGVSGRTFARLLSSGKFPPASMRLSGKLMFWSRDVVEEWLEQQRQEQLAH